MRHIRRFTGLLALLLMLSAAVTALHAQDETSDEKKDKDKTPAVKIEPGDLKVMSFNIRDMASDPEKIDNEPNPNHWTQRRVRVTAVIKQFDPDILCVQEARAGQIKDLSKDLPDYSYVGSASYDGRSRGLFNAIFYRKDRFRRLRDGMLWLSEKPTNVGSRSWNTAEPRTAAWVRLRDEKAPDNKPGKGEIMVLNTQFDKEKRDAAIESSKLLRNLANTTRDEIPVIMAGDFHYSPKSYTYSHLLSTPVNQAAPELIDSFRFINPNSVRHEGTEHGFENKRGGSRKDWILHSSHMRTITAGIDDTQIDEQYPSHHFPVTAVMRYDAQFHRTYNKFDD